MTRISELQASIVVANRFMTVMSSVQTLKKVEEAIKEIEDAIQALNSTQMSTAKINQSRKTLGKSLELRRHLLAQAQMIYMQSYAIHYASVWGSAC